MMKAVVRETVAKSAYLSAIWTLYRAWQQERKIRFDREFYHQRAREEGLSQPLEYDSLQKLVRERLASRGVNFEGKSKGSLRIVHATPMPLWERYNIPPALKRFGDVYTFDSRERGFNDRADDWVSVRYKLDEALLAFVKELHQKQPIDAFVSYLSGYLVSPETISAINEMGIFTCAWWLDDKLYFKGEKFGDRYLGSASLASIYDLNLTSSTECVAKYFVEGGLAMFWPLAGNPDLCKQHDREFEYDVSFIGACYGARPGYIRYLEKHGVRVEAFGRGWPNGMISAEEMVEVIAKSRINLGFCGIGYSMREMCLKERDFSIPMSGGLFLCNDFPDLHRVYEVGKEVASFRNKADCLAKIRALLADPERCAAMRRAARERALREHTWEQRFEDVFSLVGLLEDTEKRRLA